MVDILDVKQRVFYRKLVKKEPEKTVKIPNISENEVNQAEKLQRKSIDELNWEDWEKLKIGIN